MIRKYRPASVRPQRDTRALPARAVLDRSTQNMLDILFRDAVSVDVRRSGFRVDEVPDVHRGMLLLPPSSSNWLGFDTAHVAERRYQPRPEAVGCMPKLRGPDLDEIPF